jgi:hypothetical protein
LPELHRGFEALHVGICPRSHVSVILRVFVFSVGGMSVNKETFKFQGNPTLETERLILRKLEISDAQDIFDYAKHLEVAKYMTWEAHKSIENAKGFIDWTLERIV